MDRRSHWPLSVISVGASKSSTSAIGRHPSRESRQPFSIWRTIPLSCGTSKIDITFWNRGAEEKYGWKREEALGQLAHTFLQTQFSEPLEEVEETLRRNRYWEGEVVHTAKNGKRIVVASRRVLQCDPEGKPTAILEINNDITERKQTEEALRRSEERLRGLFEFSPDAIVVTNREGKIGEVNAQVEKFFGYGRSELLGQPIEILIPERFRGTHPKHRADYAAHPVCAPWVPGSSCMAGVRTEVSSRSISCSGLIEGAEGPVVLGRHS